MVQSPSGVMMATNMDSDFSESDGVSDSDGLMLGEILTHNQNMPCCHNDGGVPSLVTAVLQSSGR